MLRWTNLLPKPSSLAGAAIGGPPRSVHVTTTSSSLALHDTSNVPLARESAPYLAEFITISWITKTNVAHLARQQFVGFLGLLPLRNIKEDAEH